MNGNLERLLQKYTSDRRIKELVRQLNSGEDDTVRIIISGITGAIDSLVLSALYQADSRSHLFIGDDKDDAAYFQNNVSNLLEKVVHFLPDSFKRPKKFEDLDSSNILQRTEIVNKISSTKKEKGEIIVSYPESIFEKVVSPIVLDKHRLEIITKEKLNVKTIIEVLTEYDFRREEFVSEPGQFSIRGAIIDIFSYGNEWPYRIELFDEEVETIRTFDPLTQLSQQNISKVSIIPNINTRFTHKEKVSLFQVLPQNTIIWVRDLQDFIERIQNCFDEAFRFANTISALDKSELAEIFRDRAFIRPADVIESIQRFPIICLSNRKQPIPFPIHITLNSKPQPSFNKNFSLLINDFTSNQTQGIESFLFAENPRQIERFYSIFEDLNAKIDFHPIPTALHQGFIDLDAKVACYTDHQIFDRFHRFKIRQGFF
ncbi:MAG: hypothetical protein HC892_08925 [Saprospiraceae bacterium]|nr:hypothetical protein [Saprospiraceae bacterium]